MKTFKKIYAKMIIKFNTDVFSPQVTDLKSADLGLTSFMSNKTSEQKNSNCHNTSKLVGFIQHRKLHLPSCLPRVLNTEAKVDMREEECQSKSKV